MSYLKWAIAGVLSIGVSAEMMAVAAGPPAGGEDKPTAKIAVLDAQIKELEKSLLQAKQKARDLAPAAAKAAEAQAAELRAAWETWTKAAAAVDEAYEADKPDAQLQALRDAEAAAEKTWSQQRERVYGPLLKALVEVSISGMHLSDARGEREQLDAELRQLPEDQRRARADQASKAADALSADAVNLWQELLGPQQSKRDEFHDNRFHLSNGRAEIALGRKLPELNFKDVALGDFVNFMHDVTGIEVLVDWQALQAAAGITLETTITYQATDVPEFEAYKRVFGSAKTKDGRPPSLAYWGRQHFLLITTTVAMPRWLAGPIARLRELRRDPAKRAFLDRSLPHEPRIDMTLAEAFDYFGRATGARMAIDWNALTAVGATRDAHVNVSPETIPAGEALLVILGQGGAGPDVEFAVDGGTVRIGKGVK